MIDKEIFLNKDDMIHVDSGNMPPSRVKQYISEIKETLKGVFPESVKTVYLPFDGRECSHRGTFITVIHAPR